MASFTGNRGDTRISIEEIVIDLWDRLESILGKKFARKSIVSLSDFLRRKFVPKIGSNRSNYKYEEVVSN